MMSNTDFISASPITCNINFTNRAYETFKDYSQVDVISTDFAKAIDSVNYNGFVNILKTSGIGDHLLSRF